MDANHLIPKAQFEKRLVNLCLSSGLTGFPKGNLDQQILLKSAVLLIRKEGCISEKEINELLQLWFLQVCQIKNIDHVMLRRWLVDAGYLARSSDGTCYRVALPGPRYFEPEVDQIDLLEVIRTARADIARRKQEHQSSSPGR